MLAQPGMIRTDDLIEITFIVYHSLHNDNETWNWDRILAVKIITCTILLALPW